MTIRKARCGRVNRGGKCSGLMISTWRSIRISTGSGFSERMFSLEWLHVDGDESLPVQLDMKRVISALELPFTVPGTFWKLP